LTEEVELLNTPHHKSIIKARNENYDKFKQRFLHSIKDIMHRFDEDRKEELRFNSYWGHNLKEITMKHI
jgi:hypothetical protein